MPCVSASRTVPSPTTSLNMSASRSSATADRRKDIPGSATSYHARVLIVPKHRSHPRLLLPIRRGFSILNAPSGQSSACQQKLCEICRYENQASRQRRASLGVPVKQGAPWRIFCRPGGCTKAKTVRHRAQRCPRRPEGSPAFTGPCPSHTPRPAWPDKATHTSPIWRFAVSRTARLFQFAQSQTTNMATKFGRGHSVPRSPLSIGETPTDLWPESSRKSSTARGIYIPVP
ncbi:hypothetical protein OH76DRAFT_247669 [Lentinus brumalis]|uniref:Uncharacterized protein n=1 Tax=Lentinus brumalis TaxID=2498619 RepID=A0A371CLR7_9APHY|nr:hypothetical protein OH76DRAFT_247669 [Polyporus brumalis]